MRVSLFVMAAATLVGAHAAAVQSENSTSEPQELDRRLFGSHCDDSSDSDNESGGGKQRRAEKCGEIQARVQYISDHAFCVRKYPERKTQRCDQQDATAGSICWIKTDQNTADCPH